MNREAQERIDAYLALRRVYKLLIRAIGANLKSLGTTDSQFGVLRTLSHTSGVSIGEISQWVLTCNANLTSLIDRMEKKKLVTRTVRSEDKRWRHISLTGEGQKLADRAIAPHRQYVAELFAGLSGEDLDNLRIILEKLQAAVETNGA